MTIPTKPLETLFKLSCLHGYVEGKLNYRRVTLVIANSAHVGNPYCVSNSNLCIHIASTKVYHFLK